MKGSRARPTAAKEGKNVREVRERPHNNREVEVVHSTPDRGGRVHKCRQCGKQFHFQSTLISHLKTHGVLRFRCPICARTFRSIHEFHEHDHHLQYHPVLTAATPSASVGNNLYSTWNVYRGQGQTQTPRPVLTIPLQPGVPTPPPRLSTSFPAGPDAVGLRRVRVHHVHYSSSVALAPSTSGGRGMTWTQTQQQIIAVGGHYSGVVSGAPSHALPFQVSSNMTTVTWYPSTSGGAVNP